MSNTMLIEATSPATINLLQELRDLHLNDNNVISNYFSGLFPKKTMDFIADVFDLIPNISLITVFESLSWHNPDISKERIIKEFIDDANVLALSPDVVMQCIAIRRSKKIKTPDAINTATAIVHDFTLITSDADFKGIQIRPV